jgi:hypothetical protein
VITGLSHGRPIICSLETGIRNCLPCDSAPSGRLGNTAHVQLVHSPSASGEGEDHIRIVIKDRAGSGTVVGRWGGRSLGGPCVARKVVNVDFLSVSTFQYEECQAQ